MFFLRRDPVEKNSVSFWGRRDLWAEGQLEYRYDVRCVLTQLAERYKTGLLVFEEGFA